MAANNNPNRDGWDDWEELELPFFKFQDEGDSLEGVFLSSEPFTYANGDTGTRYTVKTDDGPVLFMGTSGLNQKMTLVSEGDFIRVTYRGIDPTDDRSMKMFSVQRRRQRRRS